jgi:hypothetical protein
MQGEPLKSRNHKFERPEVTGGIEKAATSCKQENSGVPEGKV